MITVAFTAKIKVTNVQADSVGDQKQVSFTANYTDASGERVNQEWAKYTPGFSLQMWLTNEFLDAHPELAAGQDFTLTFEKDEA